MTTTIPARRPAKKKHYDADQSRELARGNWSRIIPALVGSCGLEYLTGAHGPCPVCGGRDRFRFTDMDGNGSSICNQCGRHGDGFATLMWLRGIKFPEALAMVAEYIGAPATTGKRPASTANRTAAARPKSNTQPGKGNNGPVIDPAEHLEFDPQPRLLAIQTWALSKPPIDAEAVVAAGGKVARYRGQYTVVALPHFVSLDDSPPKGWTIYNQGGGTLPGPKNAAGEYELLKVKVTKGSRQGLIGDKSRIANASTRVLVEGPGDALALLSSADLPADWAVVSTSNGCDRLTPETLEIFRGKSVMLIGDADKPGQESILGRTDQNGKHRPGRLAQLQGVASEVRHVLLPYEIVADHGKDVRDYLNEGHTFAELLALVESTAPWTGEAVAADAAGESIDDGEAAGDGATRKVRSAEENAELTVRAIAKIGEGPAAIFTDAELLADLAELLAEDPANFAQVREAARKAKVQLKLLDAAVKKAARPVERPEYSTDRYANVGDCLCRIEYGQDGERAIELGNFAARIVDETIHDDGVERKITFGIQGRMQNGGRPLPRIEVSGAAFGEGDWIASNWGSDPIIWPGSKYHFIAAIQSVSTTKRRLIEYTHTGVREVEPGVLAYLHGGGAISEVPLAEPVTVSLRHPLTNYILPDPQAVDARKCVTAVLKLLELSSSKGMMFALVAAPFRAVFGGVDFSIHLVGRTGVFKSEVAALIQQFFGAGLDSRSLPGSWSSTANFLEMSAFLAKDALFAVDDFVPSGGANDVARLNRDADRLLRGQGNHSGRGRMKSDGSTTQAKPPRGMILSTGEDHLSGQSLQARTLTLELQKGDVSSANLTSRQIEAAAGLYAGALASFIQWMLPRYSSIKSQWKGKITKLRSELTENGQHARTPGIAAELNLAFRLFLKFAHEQVGAINSDRRDQLKEECQERIGDTTAVQADQQSENDPTQQFLELLNAAISSGRAHLAGEDGEWPREITGSRWGWRSKKIWNKFGGHDLDWNPLGERIGWVDHKHVYLQPKIAYAVAEGLAKHLGRSLSITPQTLSKRLAEAGLLAVTGDKRRTLTRRKTFDGKNEEVLWIFAEKFAPPEDEIQAEQNGESDSEQEINPPAEPEKKPREENYDPDSFTEKGDPNAMSTPRR